MNIQMASADHVEAIRELYRELFQSSAYHQPQYYQAAEASQAFIMETIADEKSDIIVAVQDYRVVGFAVVKELRTPPYSCIIPY